MDHQRDELSGDGAATVVGPVADVCSSEPISPPSVTSPQISEWRAGWRPLVAAVIGVGTTYSLFLLSAGLFIVPMQAEFGWSRSATVLGPMVMVISGLLNPVAGILVDRYSARRVAIVGVFALASAHMLLAIAPADKRYVYAVVVYLAAAGAMTNVIAYSRVVASWFRRNIGIAIGLTTSGLACSMAMPFLYAIVRSHGWRAGYFVLAGIALLALPFLFAWLREQSVESLGQTSDTDVASAVENGVGVAQAFGDVRLWLLVVALGASALAIGGFLSQMVPLLQSRGVNPGVVAAVASVFSITIAIGRIGAGWLLDFTGRPNLVASLFFVMAAIGATTLALPDLAAQPWIVVASGAILIELTVGAEADFSAFFVVKLFGLKSYSMLYGLVLTVISLCMAGGGLLYAYIFDRFGDYRIATYGSALTFFMASLLILRLRIPKERAHR
jgi:predicted MFS family arabinose efflux permease